MAVKCFGSARGEFHLTPGGGFFADGGLCLNEPVDAASYPNNARLYAYANISGYSNANIRTIFPDGSDSIAYHHGDWMYVSWDWNGWYGAVKFELRNGTSVIATRTTNIGYPSSAMFFSDVVVPETIDFGAPCVISAMYNVDRNVFGGLPCVRLRTLFDGVVVWNSIGRGEVCGHTPTGIVMRSDVGSRIARDGLHTVRFETVLVSTQGIESPGCSFDATLTVLPPAIAQGDILAVSWAATNPYTGEPSSIAYWGFNINLSVDVKNLGDIQENYKLQAWQDTTLLAESAVFALAGGQQSSIPIPFVMPRVNSLNLMIKLVIGQ